MCLRLLVMFGGTDSQSNLYTNNITSQRSQLRPLEDVTANAILGKLVACIEDSVLSPCLI